MQKSDIKILLVEDDETLGQAIRTALEKDGFSVGWARSADIALSSVRSAEYHAAVIDCMLPKINGVEVAKKVKNLLPEIKIIFTSGVFKDRTFASDAISTVKAEAFLSKPFELKKLLEILNKTFEEHLDSQKEPLLTLMAENQLTNDSVTKVFERTGTVHGYDLPWVFALMTRTTLSGEMDLIYASGEIAHLKFHHGKIIQVRTDDQTSYFGVLLVENGFTSADEVQASLESQTNKPIGETLVDANSLSPHAIQIVHQQQMGIRISKIISDTSVELKFNSCETQGNEAFIDHNRIIPMLSDWISSKIKKDWLQSLYLKWNDSPVAQAETLSSLDLISSYPAGQMASAVLNEVDSQKTIQDIAEQFQDNEIELYRCFHFLVLTGILKFRGQSSSTTDLVKLKRRLHKIHQGFHLQNHFEVLGLSNKARSKEISRAYLDLAKNLHPDRLPPNSPEDIVDLCQEVFARISEAHEVLSDSSRRKDYLRELELGQAEDILQAESLFEEGRRQLMSGRYQKALKIFEEIAAGKSHPHELKLHLVWAILKQGSSSKKMGDFIAKVQSIMSEIPLEERHSATYFLVKGLYYKTTKDYTKSAINFKNAIVFDPGFHHARRELNALGSVRRRKKVPGMGEGEVTKILKRFLGSKKAS